MRAFVRLRRLLATPGELAQQLTRLAESVELHDDQIKAIAAKGGLIHSVFTFLHTDRTKGTLDDVLNHMEHIMKLVGPEHLGIGSDLDGIQNAPIGLEDTSKMMNITRGLVARGYSIGAIRQILGENFLRVFAQITRE